MDNQVGLQSFHQKIDRYYGLFGAALFAAAVMTAAMVNPDENHPTGKGFYATVVPHLFLFTFFPWITLFTSWVSSICVRKDYHRLVGSNVVYVVRLGFDAVMSLHEILLVRSMVYIALMFVGVQLSKWFYYHFDIMYTLRTIFQFIWDAAEAFMNPQALSIVIHRWVRNTFMGSFVVAIGYLEKSSDAFIAQNAIWGFIMISGILLIIILTVATIRTMIDKCKE